MDTYTVNCSITPISSWLVFLAISYKRGAGGTNIILRASLLQGYIALNFEIYEKAAILMKKSLTLLPGLLLVGLLACLSGCGTNSGTGNVPQGKPDSVSIQIDEVIGGKKVVTLSVASMAQQLYTTIYALPQLPENQPCTADFGPHYTLTFNQGGKPLVTVIAMRYGCKPVSITGESQDRQASSNFWAQLDQAIYHASPSASVQWLAVMRAPQTGQWPLTTRITSTGTAQRLYNAIQAQPLTSPNIGYLQGSPTYQLIFHTDTQEIPSAIDTQRNLISLNGNLQSRTGLYSMNDQFKLLLNETLAGATFAPAHPDAASLSIQKSDLSSEQVLKNMTFIEQFYAKFNTLQSAQAPQDCPSGADKVAGKGTLYNFLFSQWSLPVLQVEVYEGSCKLIQNTSTGQSYQGDQEFWNFVHRAPGQ
jgi:hypothetical protein